MLKKTFKNAIIISAGILAGRLAGYAREIILAKMYGDSHIADKIILMMSSPDMLNNLLSVGAISGLLIPTLAKDNDAQKILKSLLINMLQLVTIMIMILSGILFFKNDLVAASMLSLSLLSIYPNIFSFVFSSYLQYQGKFQMQSLSTFVFNLSIIGVIFFGFVDFYFAIGLIFCCLIRSFWIFRLIPIDFLKGVFRSKFLESVQSKKNIIVCIMASGLIFINPLIDKLYIEQFGVGAVSQLSYAEKIYLLPVSTFLTTYAIAIFSDISILVAERKYFELYKISKKIFIINLLMSSVLALFMYIFASEITNLFYMFSNLNTETIKKIATYLQCYCIAVAIAGSHAFFINLVLAFGKNKYLLYYGCLSVLLKMILNFSIVKLNISSIFIPLSTSLITLIACIIAVVIFLHYYRKISELDLVEKT